MWFRMDRRILFLVVVALLSSCQFALQPRIENDYQNENSEIISALITSQELLEISKEFSWWSILSSQEAVDPGSELVVAYEVASRKYKGQYKTSDNFVTIWHTIKKYKQPIDMKDFVELEFGVYKSEIKSTYVPQIKIAQPVNSQCIVLHETGQICRVDVKYNYIESNLYIFTEQYYEEDVLSKWLNAILKDVEPRILEQDFAE